MVPISLVPALTLMYFYISTFRSMCAVPNMAVSIFIIMCFLHNSNPAHATLSRRAEWQVLPPERTFLQRVTSSDRRFKRKIVAIWPKELPQRQVTDSNR
jgi:hypothetical protein